MADGKNTVFRVVLGVICFCISFFFALCVLIAGLNFANPLLKSGSGDDALAHSAGVLIAEGFACSIFIALTVWAGWGGIRLMKPPGKKKEKVALLGEQF